MKTNICLLITSLLLMFYAYCRVISVYCDYAVHLSTYTQSVYENIMWLCAYGEKASNQVANRLVRDFGICKLRDVQMADVAERTRRMIGHIPNGKHREYIKMQSETLTFYALERLLHVYQGCLRVKKDADEVIEILVDYQIVRAE